MERHKEALQLLCQEIITGTNPKRGEQKAWYNHHFQDTEGDKLTHIPAYLDRVREISVSLETESEDNCCFFLEQLTKEVFQEGSIRFPAVPAYFGIALEIADQLDLFSFNTFYKMEKPRLHQWNQLLRRLIEKIAQKRREVIYR